MGSKDPGGPIALALSARSNVFAEFEGGPGQIGIHGRDNLGGTLGQAESHGCVRLHPSNATTLFGLVQSEGMRKTTIVVQ